LAERRLEALRIMTECQSDDDVRDAKMEIAKIVALYPAMMSSDESSMEIVLANMNEAANNASPWIISLQRQKLLMEDTEVSSSFGPSAVEFSRMIRSTLSICEREKTKLTELLELNS
jgi:CMP-N-acetylneuraminic acid synthetase